MAANTKPYKSIACAKTIIAGMPLYRKIARCRPVVIKMGNATATDTKAGKMLGPDSETE
jgi:hypothetical protein